MGIIRTVSVIVYQSGCEISKALITLNEDMKTPITIAGIYLFHPEIKPL